MYIGLPEEARDISILSDIVGIDFDIYLEKSWEEILDGESFHINPELDDQLYTDDLCYIGGQENWRELLMEVVDGILERR